MTQTISLAKDLQHLTELEDLEEEEFESAKEAFETSLRQWV